MFVMVNDYNWLRFFLGFVNVFLFMEVVRYLGLDLGLMVCKCFVDGELYV